MVIELFERSKVETAGLISDDPCQEDEVAMLCFGEFAVEEEKYFARKLKPMLKDGIMVRYVIEKTALPFCTKY